MYEACLPLVFQRTVPRQTLRIALTLHCVRNPQCWDGRSHGPRWTQLVSVLEASRTVGKPQCCPAGVSVRQDEPSPSRRLGWSRPGLPQGQSANGDSDAASTPAKEETRAERLYANLKRWSSRWGDLSRKFVARNCPRSQERSEGRAAPRRRLGAKPLAQRYSKAEVSGLR